MNLADSVKKVLRSRSQNIFSDFWKDDLKSILVEIGQDISRLSKNSKKSFHNLKNAGMKTSFKELADSGADALIIFKVLPGRIKDGFLIFKDEFITELESLPDQKQKTIFCLKVLGALTSFILGAIYNVKKGKSDFSMKGLRRRNAFTRFIVAELIFRISQVFLYRFLTELEKEVTDTEDLKNIRYFKDLMANRNSSAAVTEDESVTENESDRSIQMVDALKQFILTGK